MPAKKKQAKPRQTKPRQVDKTRSIADLEPGDEFEINGVIYRVIVHGGGSTQVGRMNSVEVRVSHDEDGEPIMGTTSYIAERLEMPSDTEID